ncbi:hypothetical protein [Streptomyces sp. NPDC060065]|uniref:hypothetical protein n=1 Tax=Streptomyces sp. NPDC060065 TaxID=3347050 RepID=UPI0036B68A2D
MSVLVVLAVIGIVVVVIGRQLAGEPLRGKRVLLLPAILAVVGVYQLSGHGEHPTAPDIGLLVAGAVVAAGIGAGQGSVMRLENRGGALWGQLPVIGLWLWGALIASRVLTTLVASELHAHVAASSAAILLMLGVNRLGQAAVITRRALASGVPFAPEKDGKVFLGNRFGRQN